MIFLQCSNQASENSLYSQSYAQYDNLLDLKYGKGLHICWSYVIILISVEHLAHLIMVFYNDILTVQLSSVVSDIELDWCERCCNMQGLYSFW